MLHSKWFYALHVTDTHLCESKDGRRLGKPPFQNLQKLVRYLIDNNLKVDLVLHSGDIAGAQEIGQKTAYEQAAELFNTLKIPTYYAIGNHDDPIIVKQMLLPNVELLGEDQTRCSYSFVTNGIRFFVLDARIGEAPHSRLPQDQLDHLESSLANMEEEFAVIVNHYQVLPIDVPWFEYLTYGSEPSSMLMENGTALHEILVKFKEKIIGVLQGHIHSSLTWSFEGITYFCAPSTDTNIRNWPNDLHESRVADGLIGFNLIGFGEGKMVVRHIQI